MIMQTLKAGTRIETLGEYAERATIARWTARNGSIKNYVSPTNGGWHIVCFEDGGSLCMHETSFRLIDNR